MKKLLLTLILLCPIFLFGQQLLPPAYNWQLIYNDTVGQGYKTAEWSYALDGNAAGDSMYFSDTTAWVNLNTMWGSLTLWLEIDVLNTVKTVDSLDVRFAYWNEESSNWGKYYNLDSTFARIDTVKRGNLVDGDLIINVAAKLKDLDAWTPTIYGSFYFGSLDTLKIRAWIKRQ